MEYRDVTNKLKLIYHQMERWKSIETKALLQTACDILRSARHGMIRAQVDVILDYPKQPEGYFFQSASYPVLHTIFNVIWSSSGGAPGPHDFSTNHTSEKPVQTCPDDTPLEPLAHLNERFKVLLRQRKALKQTIESLLNELKVEDEMWKLCDLDFWHQKAEGEDVTKLILEIDEPNELGSSYTEDILPECNNMACHLNCDCHNILDYASDHASDYESNYFSEDYESDYEAEDREPEEGELDYHSDGLDEEESSASEAADPADVAALPKRLVDASLMDKEECAICRENFALDESVTTLPCDHLFHTTCVEPWLLNQSKTCPYCRQAVTKNDAEDLDAGATTFFVDEVFFIHILGMLSLSNTTGDSALD